MAAEEDLIERCEFIHVHEDIVAKVTENMPDEETLYDLADLFRLFADSTRIKILYVLFESEMCVCDIAQLLGMTQSAISHQLQEPPGRQDGILFPCRRPCQYHSESGNGPCAGVKRKIPTMRTTPNQHRKGENIMKKKYAIEVDCANCAQKVEDAINKVEGVTSATVSFVQQKLIIEAEDDRFDEIMANVVKAAKKAESDFEIEL